MGLDPDFSSKKIGKIIFYNQLKNIILKENYYFSLIYFQKQITCE